MTTRADLLNAIFDEIDRPDIADTNPKQPGLWVMRAEKRIERELRCRQMLTTVDMPLASNLIPFPADFLSAENFSIGYVNGAKLGTLAYKSAQELDQIRFSGWTMTPVPAFYSTLTGQIEVYPVPGLNADGTPAYSVKLGYYAKLPPLVNDTDTNWLLADKFDIYFNAVLVYAYRFLREDDRATTMDGTLSADILVANTVDGLAVQQAGRLVARSRNPLGIR